jgi:hypothetical protein
VKDLIENQLDQIRDRLDDITLILGGFRRVEGLGASKLSAALAAAELGLKKVLNRKNFSLGVRYTTRELHPSPAEASRESLWAEAGASARRAAGFRPVKQSP